MWASRIIPCFALVALVTFEVFAECGSDPTETCMGRCGGLGTGYCYCDSSCNVNGDCCKDFEECCPHCVNPCVGKECGDDGCGGTCGSCPYGPQWSCVSGKCICTPYCTGKVCGSDGCGGSCGTCPAGQVCSGGKCVTPQCIPNCTGRVCGDGGCPDQPNACGVCPKGQVCTMWGQCVAEPCTPNCTNKECGDDGCGGFCGTCATGETCDATGHCVKPCVPQCVGKECGDDHCGGVCGFCGPNEHCTDEGKCVGIDMGSEEDLGNGATASDEASVSGEDAATDREPAKDFVAEEGTLPQDLTGSTITCPPGTVLSYGRCVPTNGPRASSGGGCFGARAPSSPLVFLLLLSLLITVARRGNRGAQRRFR